MFERTTVVLLLATAALAQTPTFGPFERNHFSPDPGPTTTAATAEIDGDGDLDALFFGATLLCYRNDGHAVFTAVPLQLPSLPFVPVDIVAGDIDGDGDDDLFLLGADSPLFGRNAMLLRNLGNFTFTVDAQPVFAAWDRLAPQFVDVDGDGDLDCLGWGHLRNSITRFFVFRNDGSGTFTDVSAQAFPNGGTTPSQARYAIADFDHNGRADIVVVVGSTAGLDLLRCDATGVFRRETAESGHFFFGLISGDIDGDGYPDLLVDAASGPFMTPALRRASNDRNGHFAVDDVHVVVPDVSTAGMRLADLDADGRDDLMLPGGVWYRSHGSAFGAAQYLPMVFDLGQRNVADLNGDLLPDLLGAGPHPRLLLATDRIAVDRAAREGRVGDPGHPTTVLDRRDSPSETVLAQLHDGRLEYVTINHAYAGQSPRLRVSGASLMGPLVGASIGELARSQGFDLWPETGLLWSDGALHLGFPAGNQVLEVPGALADPGAPVLGVRAGRLFRDDFDDIVVAIGTAAHPSLLVYSLFGSGYKKIPFALPANSGGRGVHLADVDGDGDLDVICGVAVLRHDVGTLVPMSNLGPLGPGSSELLPFDMDGDGDADLITSGGQLFESSPTGYRDVTLGRVPPGTYLQVPSAGDIDGDGDLDVMASNGVLLRNDGRQFTRFLGIAHAGALVDLDGSGEASVFDGNELWFGSHNRLHAPWLPQLGADYEVRITTWRKHAVANLAVVMFGSALDNSHWPQQVAVGTAQPVALALTGGEGTARMRVPAAMALYGARFYLQAVAFDGASAQLTNLLAEQIR